MKVLHLSKSMAAHLGLRAKAARQSALLWVLAVAAEKQLPLVPEIEALAAGASTVWRKRLYELADVLRAGAALPAALEQCRGLLPPQVMTAIRVGAASGTLPQTLRMLAHTFCARQGAPASLPESMLLYAVFVLLMMASTTGFVMYYIMPKFKKIFEDFGTGLPGVTLLVIRTADVCAEYFYLGIPALLLAAWIVIPLHVAWATGAIPRGGPFRWLGMIAPRVYTPDLLRLLAVVVEAGRPLSGALSSLAVHHPDRSVGRRLSRAAGLVAEGADGWQALASQGMLGRKHAAVLDAAQRVGNLPWALRESAVALERQLEFRMLLAFEFLRPAIVLALGVFVAWIVVGLFMPLVKLLKDLS